MSSPVPAARVVEVNAIFGRIEAFEGDLITKQIRAFGAHTRPELAFLLSVVDQGDAVFDIGGHIGTFAIPLAQKVGPHGRVLVVEGSPEILALLRRNIARVVPGSRVAAVNFLLAPDGQSYALREVATNSGASFFEPVDGPGGVDVPCTTLDALSEAHFVPRIIKLDVEGWEAWALSQSSLLLAARPIIYAEVNDALLRKNGSSSEVLDRRLRDCGYRLFTNVGARNARDDKFEVMELKALGAGGDFFDVLALHRDDDRLARLAR